MRMRNLVAVATVIAIAAIPTLAQPANNLLANPDFETLRPITVEDGGLWHGWTIAGEPPVPAEWSFNTRYVGSMEVRRDDPHSGAYYLRVAAPEGDSSHVYQIREDFEVGQWYRISAHIRGGAAGIYMYEYYDGRQMSAPLVARATAPSEWTEVFGYYRPEAEDFAHAGVAIAVSGGHEVDIDDLRVEPLDLPAGLDAGPDVVLENPLVRLTIGGDGRLMSVADKATGAEYALDEVPVRVLQVVRSGQEVPLHSLTREGDMLRAQFLDPEVQVALRIEERDSHILLEVAQVQPDDVEALVIDLPLRKLATVAAAFNAVYDDDFGVAMRGLTINTHNVPAARGESGWSLRSRCTAAHGMEGARFAIIASPRDGFEAAVMDTERANDLPSPMYGDQWMRFSDFARESYLFATRTTEADIPTLIEYAKLGGFGTIILLKNDWLKTHGHYEINTDSYPDGMESLRRSFGMIREAGLHGGVHLFGPTISANDPWVTPVPHEELAYVELPALAEAIDAEATTITLAEQPANWPPEQWRSRAFPGNTLRIGDELIDYAAEEVGPPFRFTGCVRGAAGTVAAAHDAGVPVRGMLKQWGFFAAQPDGELADQLTTNFAEIVNDLDLDMVYFDASEGANVPYYDQWYYLNKMHLDYYRKFDHDVLYQTSNGTGTNLLWHIVPRSASADGHGDIKGYLDGRWPGIMNQAANWTRSDIGWYYMFHDVRPDQIEYVRAKALGLGGSISIETARASLESLPMARKTFDMLARYERARLAGYPSPEVRQQMLEPGQDFRLFEDDGDFSLYRAVYEEPRRVDVLDGERNRWSIASDRPAVLGVEIVRGNEAVAAGAYEEEAALTIEDFSETSQWLPSDTNQFEQYVRGGMKMLSDTGPVMAGVTQEIGAADEAKLGGNALLWTAENTAPQNAWSGIGRRFEPLLDLSAYSALGMWVHGDALHEIIRVQLWDVNGRYAEKLITVDFSGWSLHTFPLVPGSGFDPSQIEYMVMCLNNISRGATVRLMIDDVRAIPDTAETMNLVNPTLVVNGRRVELPVTLEPGQAVSFDGPSGATFWPVGMVAGEAVSVASEAFDLIEGDNTVVLEAAGEFPGDVSVILHRMWPAE